MSSGRSSGTIQQPHLPRSPEQVAPEPCAVGCVGYQGDDAAELGVKGHAGTSPTGPRSCVDKSKNALPL